MRRILPLAALVLAATAWLLARTADAPDGQFRFTSSGSISTLDPASMSWIQELRLAGLLYEGLYASDAKTMQPVPAAAERVDIDDTRTHYTFHIRPNARWSNGDPLTAHDFIYAWRRAIEPGTTADYAFFFDDIAGLHDYVDWRWHETTRIAQLPTAERKAAVATHLADADRRFTNTVGLNADNEKTLRVTLRRPVAYWLDLASFAVMYPLHRATLEPFRRVGDTGLIFYDEQWAKPGHTAYNGPYTLTAWRFKRGLRLERNAHYWDSSRIHIDSVAYIDVADPNTAWLMFSSGRLDFLPSIETTYAPALAAIANRDTSSMKTGDYFASLQPPNPRRANRPSRDGEAHPNDQSAESTNVPTSESGHWALGTGHSNSDIPPLPPTPYPLHPSSRSDLHLLPAFGTYYYNFNCRPALWDGRPNPFADPRVRRAFALATDRDTLVRTITRRGEIPATTLVPQNVIPDYPHLSGLAFNIAQARAELASAGFPDGRGLPDIHLLYSTDAANGLLAESLAEMWRANLGVKTRLIAKEVQSFREDKKKQIYMLCSASWYGDYLDPTSFLDTLRTGNGNNDSDFRDAAFDARLAAAEQTTDPRERLAMLAAAETYLVNDPAPILPLYRYVHVVAFDPQRVRGLQLNPRLVFSLKDVEIRQITK